MTLDERTITSADATPVPLRWSAQPAPGGAAVVLVPALGTRAARYDGFAKVLAAAGHGVVVTELRGVGASPVRPSRDVDFGYEQLISNDLEATLGAVEERWPDAPVVLAGHSLGGQIAGLYAAAHPQGIRALVLVASGSVHWRAFGVGGPAVLAFFPVARAAAAVFGTFPGRFFRFGNREARTLIRDWAHLGMTGRWEPVGATRDYEALLGELTVPVLSVTYDRDAYGPRRSADALLRKLRRASVTRRVITSAELGARADHYEWARRPEATVAVIHAWLREHGALANPGARPPRAAHLEP